MNFTEGANMEMLAGVGAQREQARQPAAKETTIAELARKALRESGGDTESAVEALADELLSDAVLLRALIRPAVMDAVIYRVEHSMRDRRGAILRSVDAAQAGPDSVAALAAGLGRALLDFPLANGLKLRDATRDQVLAQAERYAATAKDAGHKERWLKRVAEATPARKKVGRALNNDRVAAMWRETAGEA
jgi:hypothetical protein